MEESEKLCDRMTIMVAGLMKCIGTAQHLKYQYAQGFSAKFKIRDLVSKQELKKIKEDFEDAFCAVKCILKDQNKVRFILFNPRWDFKWYLWLICVFCRIEFIVLPNKGFNFDMVSVVWTNGESKE